IEDGGQPLAQFVQPVRIEREAAGEFMAAEVREAIGDALELRVKVDGRNAARRSDAAVALDRHRQRRPVILVRDPAGREAENTFVPVLAGEDESSVAELPRRPVTSAHLGNLAAE